MIQDTKINFGTKPSLKGPTIFFILTMAIITILSFKYMKVKQREDGFISFRCPAGHDHWIDVKTESFPEHRWTFNNNFNSPTLTPSVMERAGWFVDSEVHNKTESEYSPTEINSYKCHFILTDGILDFQTDCSHGLAGKKVPLVDID